MGLMGVPASNLKRLGPTKEEEDMWKRAVYYSRLSQQTDNPKGADQIYNEARAAGRAGLPYQVTTPKGSKTYGQATYKKKSSPWSAALAADKNLAQQYRRRRGFMNKRRGTGGRISARHTTYMEARPSDTDLSIIPGSPSDRWVLTPESGSGIRQTLYDDPAKFTGKAYAPMAAAAGAPILTGSAPGSWALPGPAPLVHRGGGAGHLGGAFNAAKAHYKKLAKNKAGAEARARRRAWIAQNEPDQLPAYEQWMKDREAGAFGPFTPT